MVKLNELAVLGQSIWYDNIRQISWPTKERADRSQT